MAVKFIEKFFSLGSSTFSKETNMTVK